MNRPIIIDSWQKGIAPSPHLSLGNVVNCDIYSSIGALRINPKTTLKSSTTVVGRPNWIVRNPLLTSEIYCLDDTGRLYYSDDSGGTWSNLSDVAVTGEADDDLFTTVSAHGLEANDTIIFTGLSLPAGITAGTTYHIIAGGLTATKFAVSTSQGGGAVNLASDGTGTYRSAATASGNGLVYFEDHLIIARDAVLDTYGPLSSSPKFNYNWQVIDSDVDWHPMIVSKNDGMVYGGAANYIFSIEETAGDIFEPLVGASFLFTQQALDLPSNYRVKCLSELGNNLMIGTWQGSTYQDLKIADIFPWDTASPSFGQPIELNENGVNALITVKNTLYIFAGITGAIYASNGYSYIKVAQIPDYVAPIATGGGYEYYPGSVINHKGRIFFGIGNGVATVGVFSLNLETGTICVENLISTGRDGSLSTIEIGALFSTGYVNYLIGWKDSYTTSYGIDSMSGDKYTSFSAYVESPLYKVGTTKRPTSITEIEVNLAIPLATGEGVKLKYRRSLTGTWTTIKEYLYSGTGDSDTKIVGEVSSFNDTHTINDIVNIQLRVELTTGSASSTTPELLSVSLI